MENSIELDLENCNVRPVEEVKKYFDDNGFSGLPDEFLEFYAKYNGGCGFYEPNKDSSGVLSGLDDEDFYISLYTIDEILQLNEDHDIDNILIFGSDGGGEALGFDREKQEYFVIPFIDIGVEMPDYLGKTASEFLVRLYTFFNGADEDE